MSFPKSSEYVRLIVSLATEKNDIVLDFFAGSGTTAHAVMNQNAKDDWRRKFILIQLPEHTDESSEAHKAGYSTICEIGEERIRRAGEKIKAEVEAENAQGRLDGEVKRVPDIGFRVLRVDSSCYEDVRKTPAEYTRKMLLIWMMTTLRRVVHRLICCSSVCRRSSCRTRPASKPCRANCSMAIRCTA